MQTIRSIVYGGAMLAFLGCASADASIIYQFQSVTASGANFDWKYVAQLSGDQYVAPTTASGGAANNFAVVYDFFGVISASTSNLAAGLTSVVTTLELVTAPQPFLQGIPDNPAINNVHSSIFGTSQTGVLTALYTIDIISTSGLTGNLAFQSAQALKNAPGQPGNGTATGNSVQIEAPASSVTLAGIPEPATMILMGSALLGLGFLRKRLAA